MKKHILLFFMITFFSCAGASIIITDSDNNKIINAKTGDVITVNLESQLSTGYSWKVSSMKGVASKSDKNNIITLSDNRTGGKDHQVMIFSCIEKGDGEIELVQIQPWKAKSKPIKTFKINIHIE